MIPLMLFNGEHLLMPLFVEYKLVKVLTIRSELVNGVPVRKSLGSILSAKQGYPASISR